MRMTKTGKTKKTMKRTKITTKMRTTRTRTGKTRKMRTSPIQTRKTSKMGEVLLIRRASLILRGFLNLPSMKTSWYTFACKPLRPSTKTFAI
jgi:hypothetical protein